MADTTVPPAFVDGVSKFNAAQLNDIINAVNSKLDGDNIGTTAGKLVALDSAGLIPAALLPEGSGEGGGGSPGGPLIDASVTNAMLVNMAAGTVKMRTATDGAGVPIDGTATELRTMIGVEAGATADMTSMEIATALLADIATDADLASTFARAVFEAVLLHFAVEPAEVRTNLSAVGILYSEGTISENQAVIGAIDGTTAVQAADMTNGTPTVAGIIAGSGSMIATADAIASVWAPKQATLVTGALSFDATTGLQWTVAAGANNIVVAESCWTGIPLDKPATLEIVAGASARTITFTDTSVNLVDDTAASPWNATSSGTRVCFELSWVAEGAAPTVKSKRKVVFLGYYA